MEKKQSSVDHIINWVTTNGLFSEDGKSITYSCAELELVIRESLAMHREEIVDAYTECWMNDGGNGFHKVKEAESYYNETYNNENTDTTT